MAPRVLIIKDTLSTRSGTTKLTASIARALKSVGAEVDLFFFHSDGSEQLAKEQLEGLNYELFEGRATFRLSQILQYPIFKLFLKDAFSTGDAVNLFDQFAFARKLNRMRDRYDMIISMNIWTGLFFIFLDSSYYKRSIMYFHEPPVFGGLPAPVRFMLDLYLHLLLRRIEISLSLTEPMRSTIEDSVGIKTTVLADPFVVKKERMDKEDFVLLDTRWTFVRNPFFVVEIAKLLPDVKFVMCGNFGSQSLKKRFMDMLAENKLEDRILVREKNTEAELDEYYSTAKCYIRWSNPSIVETGPSYGLIQAVSNGCIPIVSMELGSSPEVSKNVGTEFSVKNDPAAFADTIRSLFTDKDFFARALDNVIRWRNGYTGKEYGKLLLNVFESHQNAERSG